MANGRMSRAALWLACLVGACGDDGSAGGSDAGRAAVSGNGGSGHAAVGGSGGAGRAANGGSGARAGGAGGAVSECAETVWDALSAWCAKSEAQCELSFEARVRRACEKLGPMPATGSQAFENTNQCGGRSVAYFLGVDTYEVAHFGANGALVGFVTHASESCASPVEVHGAACEPAGEQKRLDCSMLDAGTDD